MRRDIGERGSRPRTLRAGGAVALTCAAMALIGAGCGSDDEARSEQRPPVPVNISVQVGAERITASPDEVGAGPVTLLVANQSGAAQTLTVDGPRLSRSVGPIPPDDTATLKITVQQGDYTVSAEESAGLDSVTLTVGAARPSAQNELLLP